MIAPEGRPPPPGRRPPAATTPVARQLVGVPGAPGWRPGRALVAAHASPPSPSPSVAPYAGPTTTQPHLTTHTHGDRDGRRVAVRPATEDDWWAVASVHVESFFPKAGFLAPLLRFDRVMGLATGYENAEEGREGRPPLRGPFLCLIAVAEGEEEEEGRRRTYPVPPAPLGWLPPFTHGAFGEAGAIAGRVRGAVVLDAQGGHIPPRLVRANGTRRLVARKGLAYVSNLAVSPAARRAGLGSALLAAAEEVAWGWGARAVALHVDTSNGGAADLYARAGYRPASRGRETVAGSSGLGGLLGPAGQPLALMLKVRPRRRGGGGREVELR